MNKEECTPQLDTALLVGISQAISSVGSEEPQTRYFLQALKKHRPQTEIRTALQATLLVVQMKYYDQQSNNTAT